jgi:tRNA 2-thiouridine synthesizing protein A
MDTLFDIEIDTSGLNCPLPLLRLKKALMEAENGHIIKITATDPAAHLDFGVFLQQSGHIAIDILRDSEKQIFFIQKRLNP